MSYCYPERTTYDDTCRLKKCCVSPVFKRLGKMNMVVESCGLMVQSHDCNPHHDPCMGGGVSACLPVCVSVWIQPDITSIFSQGP